MLLATDLDGTFLSGDTATRHQLYQLITLKSDIELVFVTGRGLESVMPLLSDPTIPKPAYIICDVGATIVDGETLQSVQPLQAEIETRWPGEYVVEDALKDIPNLVRQDVPQKRRCSFFCAEDAISEEVKEIAEKLNCDILYSANRYLDFLPKGVNKGSSLVALMEHLNKSRDQVLVAGDTLNDLAMYEHNFPGVCVGKSEPGLLKATADLEHVYHAAKTGCGGILEAIKHFELLTQKEMSKAPATSTQMGSSELVIVYHRLPFEEYIEDGQLKQRTPRSPNGILPTLLSFFADGKKGAWVAWTTHSDKVDNFEPRTPINKEQYPNLMASKVALTEEQVKIFYKQFSKEAFWPTLHTFWEQASFREDHWQVFLKVNRLFALQTASEAAEGAVVWIHDYNLWMVPAFLRELRPDVTIAFFHHTYFPSADVFNVLPWRRDIIGSLLQCDFIGFHIPRQSENFIDVANGVMPIKTLETVNCAPRFLTYGCAVGLDEMTSIIEVNERQIRLGAHPVGLDLNRIKDALERPQVQDKTRTLRKHLENTRVILSVERLDYTKGILPKLQAYELLLEQYPDLIGNITLLSICVPADSAMSIYEDLQVQIEQTVGRINARFAKVGWTPVQFFFRSFSFDDLVAYYSLADIMWITPLRDGLNLVCKEFVATQGMLGGNSVLVLSEFAGAAAELRGALLTNPHDVHDLVNTCYQALTMDEDEATSRIRAAFEVVKHNDIENWGDEFMAAVSSCKENKDLISAA